MCQICGTLVNTRHGANKTLYPQTVYFLNPLSLWAQILRFRAPVSYGEGVVGERNQASAGTSGFWRRGEGRGRAGCCPWCWEERGFISLHFAAPKPSSGVKGGRETENSCGWDLFFFPWMWKIRTWMYNLNSTLRGFSPISQPALLSQTAAVTGHYRTVSSLKCSNISK